MSMSRSSLISLAVILMVVAPRAVVGVPSPQDGLDRWLEDLGNESYEVREAAQAGIWKHGADALPMLRRLAEAKDDPERMMRARSLIRKIEFEIRPDTDPDVVKWIELFGSESISGKEKILRQMKERRAWFPMLRLYAEVKEKNARARLKPIVRGVAVDAAREKLVQGDWEMARQALDLAPVDAASLMSYAVFHRSRGRWDQEWEKLSEAERKGPWGVALLRAADRVGEARDAARRLGDVNLAAWLSVLEGNPLEWIGGLEPVVDPMEKVYVKFARQRWLGEEADDAAADIERLAGLRNRRNRQGQMGAAQALFLLAEPVLAEPLYAKQTPLGAFLHYEQLEKVAEALEVMGLDPEKPDYISWYRTKFGKFAEDDIENQHGVDQIGAELSAMSGFLERKGLDDVLWDAFSERFLAYAGENETDFLNLLSMTFGSPASTSGAPAFCARIAEKWAGNNEDRWGEVLNCAFGDQEDVRAWWDWLGRKKPEMSMGERLRVQMAIYRMAADPTGIRRKWMPEILDAINEGPEWAKLVLQLAVDTKDAQLYLAAEKEMGREDPDRTSWGERIHYLSAAERWDDVVEVMERHLALQQEGGQPYIPQPHLHAYLAAALRLAGRAEGAARHDALAETLYLGEPAFALRIGNGYAFGRDYERALVWWKRACVESDLEFSEFSQAMKTLAEAWVEEGEWLRAASLYECMARLYMRPDYWWEPPLSYTSYRLHADTARALSMLDEDRDAAVRRLERIHDAYATDGSLADVFFPSLRRVGLIKEHDVMFGKTWQKFRRVIRKYPAADNTRNTAAWMSSRAARKVKEGMADIQAALARRPDQAAYLDTMAEAYFAMGNRKDAVKWSSKAMMFKPDDTMIRRQHVRFLYAPLPK